MTSEEETQKALTALLRKVTKLREQGHVSEDDVDDLKELVASLEEAGTGGFTPLETFFESVGHSLVAAQRDLDHQSRLYQASGTPLPTQYRIPKASARFKFGVSTTKEGRLGLILYSSRSGQERSQQHEVSFDVAAAPVMPEQLATPPGLAQASVPVRETIRQRFQQYIDSGGRESMAARAMIDNFEHVLCLRSGDGWTIIYPYRTDDALDLFMFTVGEQMGRDGGLGDPVFVRPRTQKQRRLLLLLFIGLADAQAAWLAARRSKPVRSE